MLVLMTSFFTSLSPFPPWKTNTPKEFIANGCKLRHSMERLS
jgi:hypothetical protein